MVLLASHRMLLLLLKLLLLDLSRQFFRLLICHDQLLVLVFERVQLFHLLLKLLLFSLQVDVVSFLAFAFLLI